MFHLTRPRKSVISIHPRFHPAAERNAASRPGNTFRPRPAAGLNPAKSVGSSLSPSMASLFGLKSTPGRYHSFARRTMAQPTALFCPRPTAYPSILFRVYVQKYSRGRTLVKSCAISQIDACHFRPPECISCSRGSCFIAPGPPPQSITLIGAKFQSRGAHTKFSVLPAGKKFRPTTCAPRLQRRPSLLTLSRSTKHSKKKISLYMCLPGLVKRWRI